MDPKRCHANFHGQDQEQLPWVACPPLPTFSVRTSHIQSRRPRPQRNDHLKQSSLTHNIQTFHRSRCIAPVRQTQNVQADTFVEIQHLSRNCWSREFGLHVFSTSITMHSSCLPNCQFRRTTVLQHTHHFFDARMSQVDVKLPQRSLDSFNMS